MYQGTKITNENEALLKEVKNYHPYAYVKKTNL